MSLVKLSSVCVAESRTVGGSRVFSRSGRGGLGFKDFVQSRARRRIFVEVGVAQGPREGVVLKVLAGVGRRAGRVAALASQSLPVADEHREAQAGSVSSDLYPLHSKKDDGNSGVSGTEDESGDEESAPTASAEPWIPDEAGKALVSEVFLNEEGLSVTEYPENEEEAHRGDAPHPLNSLVKWLENKINGGDRSFSLTEIGSFWKTGEDAGELEVPDISVSGFDVKEGVSPLAQWTSTELTMQHSQLARIVRDVIYMQLAFGFFGGVRIVEALLSVYSTSPPDFSKLKELLNALDPLTILWLANNVREPLEGLMEADPVDLEKVITLKTSAWQAVHAFFERQWKVMATLAMARSLSLIASHEPTTTAVTDKVQWLWNALMALPIF